MVNFKCCVPGCTESGDSHTIMHGMPKGPNQESRFQQWWMAIFGKKVKDPNDIIKFQRTKRVCRRHFEDKYMCRNDRISRNSIPTLFLPKKPSNHVLTDVDDDENILIFVGSDFEDQVSLYNDSNDYELAKIEAEHIETHTEKMLPHEGVSCNACHQPITGRFRYTCIQCVDWDLCSACEAHNVHPHHYVLRIPGPSPYYAEVQAVMDAIREKLKNVLLIKTERQVIPTLSDNGDSIQEVTDDEEMYVVETIEDDIDDETIEINNLIDCNELKVEPLDTTLTNTDQAFFGKIVDPDVVELDDVFEEDAVRESNLSVKFDRKDAKSNLRRYPGKVKSESKLTKKLQMPKLFVKVKDPEIVKGLKQHARVQLNRLDSYLIQNVTNR